MSEQVKSVLVVDDVRWFTFPATYVRTISEAIPAISNGHWDEVWLDHDMGLGQTGTDLARFFEYMAQDGIVADIKKVYLHSSNPVGAKEMEAALGKFYDTEKINVYAPPNKLIDYDKMDQASERQFLRPINPDPLTIFSKSQAKRVKVQRPISEPTS